MTQPPNPDNELTPTPDRRWRRRLRQIGLPIGGILLAGVAGGAWWAWVFVNERLAPLVETNLSQTLKRPVNLGRVERFSLTSLKFGRSALPATSTDPDRATVEGVEVKFNPWRVLLTRNLNLDITLLQPDLYLEQAKDGTWISTQIQAEEAAGPIRTELETIQFQDANVVLVPFGKFGGKAKPVILKPVSGRAQFLEQNERITYELAGQSATGGALNVRGETLRSPQQTNLQFRGQNFLLSEIDRLVKLPVDLRAGRGSGVVDVQLRPDEKVPSLRGTAKFEGVTLKVPQVPQAFTKASGGLQLKDTLIRLENVSGFYGNVPATARGDIDTKQGFNLTANVKPTPIPTVLDTLKVPLPVPVTGEVRADLKLTGPIQNPVLTGVAQSTKPGRVDRVDVSRFSGRFQLTAETSVLSLADLRVIPATGGQITGGGQILLKQRPTLAINLQASEIPADTILRTYLGRNAPPVSVGRVSGQAQIAGPADALVVTIPTVRATPPVGGVLTGSGRLALGDRPQIAANFQAVNVPGDAIARSYSGGNALPIAIGRVNAQGQIAGSLNNPQGAVRWQAAEATYPGSGEISLADRVITLRNTTLAVAGGTVNAQARIANGRWQAFVTGAGIALNQFSEDLRGAFSGRFALSGTLASFRPGDIRAQGEARLSQGISVLRQPLTAQVQWDGRKVIVQQATAPGFSANGFVFANIEGTPSIQGLDLNLRLQNYSLQAFAIPLPIDVQYSGRADFVGRLTGSPANPRVGGNLTLRQFVLNGVAFEPVLRGPLQVANGVNLNLVGAQDRIAVTLGADYRPIAFTVRRGEAFAQGTTRGELLRVTARQFPLAFLPPPGVALLFPPVSGDLNGEVALNLRRLSGEGTVTITKPTIGTYQADRFSTGLSFKNGVATLTNALLERCPPGFRRQFRQECTQFQLIEGSARLLGGPQQIKGELVVTNGYLQDVLELAQIFDLEDLRPKASTSTGSAADLLTVPLNLANATIQDQLRRLAEIEALRARDAQQRATGLPALRDLQGQFNAKVTVDGTLPAGINVDFNVTGQNWQWGPYLAKQVVARGSFDRGVLELVPLRLQSDDSVIAFSGQVGGEQQSGQLRVANVPIENLTAIYPLPLSIEGLLNATATLSGSVSNPQAIGDLNLTNGLLNGTEIEQAQGSFSYRNARLDFGSSLVLQGTGSEPIGITGSLPVPLTDAPISLDVNVKDAGLALLNLLNNQVALVGDPQNPIKGAVKVAVRGTIKQPLVQGSAEIQNATLQARTLPEPLTKVNGLIRFTGDRLRVETLQGQFTQGNVVAQGVLPIFDPFEEGDGDQTNPLSVTLDQIRLRLKGIYQGGVNGNIQVTGSALNPVLGGTIRLTDGEVLLSASTEGEAAGGAGGDGQPPAGSNVEFAGLNIELGDRLRVTQQPIINFLASGNLTINGTLGDLRPSGKINLRAGQVNLFTTQFNLARGYPQTATFTEAQGLDPVLDVRLIASVPEVTGSRLPTTILPSEVLDTATPSTQIGGLQTIRIQARVLGLASQLYENLELTSSPARSPSEIVALIGGGFVATLGRGDSALGIANLAGSALLTNIQSAIGNALGLSEFRLFPTLTRDDRARESSNSSSTLGLAAEAAVDITPRVSVSLLRILTSNQPTQFGLRYRLNDQLLLRGSTDFSGDSRAVLEYETRF